MELNINIGEDDESNINGEDDERPDLILDLDSLKSVIEKVELIDLII